MQRGWMSTRYQTHFCIFICLSFPPAYIYPRVIFPGATPETYGWTMRLWPQISSSKLGWTMERTSVTWGRCSCNWNYLRCFFLGSYPPKGGILKRSCSKNSWKEISSWEENCSSQVTTQAFSRWGPSDRRCLLTLHVGTERRGKGERKLD